MPPLFTVPTSSYSPRAGSFLAATSSSARPTAAAAPRWSGLGEALSMRLLKADTIWNYPAFFDYADRWMIEDDAQAVADIKTQSGYDYTASWMRQRQTKGYFQGDFPQSSFVDDMWKAYR